LNYTRRVQSPYLCATSSEPHVSPYQAIPFFCIGICKCSTHHKTSANRGGWVYKRVDNIQKIGLNHWIRVDFEYICTMSTRDVIIGKILELSKKKYPDAEIYLYGSRARGDAKPLSDWDLLILLNTKNIPFALETKIMDEFYEIELETGEILSPLIYSKEEWNVKYRQTPLYENITKESIRLI